jgi:transposase
MDAYSEDLRKKIVEAVERRAMKKSEVARLFGVSLSSVKRYVRKFRQGSSLSPGKAPGKCPNVDQRARRLLEADLKERPFAKLHQSCEYLEALAGLRVSRSTLCRTLQRMGFTRKKDCEYCDYGVRDVLPVRFDHPADGRLAHSNP